MARKEDNQNNMQQRKSKNSTEGNTEKKTSTKRENRARHWIQKITTVVLSSVHDFDFAMDPEDIAQLCGFLSLLDKEGPVIVRLFVSAT
jgi:hypothetical protein